jgi:hypothetical protein
MNEPGKAIYGILSATAAVTALVSTRIYPNNVPQNVIMPYISYTIVSTEPTLTKDVISPLDTIRISLDIYSVNYDTSQQIGAAVRKALDGYKGIINSQAVQRITFDGQGDGEYEPELNVYWQNQDYTMRLKRSRI